MVEEGVPFSIAKLRAQASRFLSHPAAHVQALAMLSDAARGAPARGAASLTSPGVPSIVQPHKIPRWAEHAPAPRADYLRPAWVGRLLLRHGTGARHPRQLRAELQSGCAASCAPTATQTVVPQEQGQLAVQAPVSPSGHVWRRGSMEGPAAREAVRDAVRCSSSSAAGAADICRQSSDRSVRDSEDRSLAVTGEAQLCLARHKHVRRRKTHALSRVLLQ